jgi:hypothetical protein
MCKFVAQPTALTSSLSLVTVMLAIVAPPSALPSA